MSRKMLQGWVNVFSFTFKQGINEKYFRPVTFGMMILLAVLGIVSCICMAIVQKREGIEVSSIEVVYVVDESGLQINWESLQEKNREKYPYISFEITEGTVEEIQKHIIWKINEDKNRVLMYIAEEAESYELTLCVPEVSRIKEEDKKEFLEDVRKTIEQSKQVASGISPDKLIYVNSGISANISEAGENGKGFGERMVADLIPLGCCFFIFMMNIMYGQNVGNVVSAEKTSRLMEMLLTMSHPANLIFGKVFSVVCIAIFQTVLWIAGLAGGFVIGDVVAERIIYSGYSNILFHILGLIKESGSNTFTFGSLFMAFLTICLSFLFYFSLAGLVASFATKAENLPEVMSYFNLIILLGLLPVFIYELPWITNTWFKTIVRFVPITGAFVLPGDIMLGEIGVWESAFYVGSLLCFTIFLVIIAGKVYKNQLFYQGMGIKKSVGKIIKE